MHLMLSVILLAQWGKLISEYGAYVTCHKRSHSVTCHPTQVNASHLNLMQPVSWYSIYRSRRNGRLS